MLLSNRAAPRTFHIAPATAQHTVTALRPRPAFGFPDDSAAAREAETACAFLSGPGRTLLQSGAYGFLNTMTWRPRQPVEDGAIGRAMGRVFPSHLRPADILVMYERGEVWVVDADGGIQRCALSFADLLDYPEANALGEVPRSTTFGTNLCADLVAVMGQTIGGFGRREETCVRVGRPVRITAKDFAALVIAILYQDAEARTNRQAVLGLKQIITDVRVLGASDAY